MWSGDCKPIVSLFPYCITWVVCKDYLTCDIAFNVVMPLSRASTHGRYSRIMGVTCWYQSLPRLRSPLLGRIAGVIESRNVLSHLGIIYIGELGILFTPQSLCRSGEASWHRVLTLLFSNFTKKNFRITRVSWNRSDGFMMRTLSWCLLSGV